MNQAKQTTLLVVDDDESSRRLLEAMLAAENYAVRCAASGEDALASVAEQLPDLLLLDIMMPGLDGFEVARRIKADARSRSIPIILVTSLEDRESRIKGLQAGADEFLTKPVDRAELQVRVRNLLKVKEYQDFLANHNRILEEQVAVRTSELHENEERFRLIAETITEVFWMADAHIGKMFYISPAYERIWGRSLQSLYENPRSFIETIHPDDRARVLAVLGLQKTGQPFGHEYRVIRPDGTLRWIWDRGFPIHEPTGEILRYVGIAQDITGRKQAEQAGRASQKLLEAIVENVPVMVFLKRASDLRFELFNRAGEELLGYSRSDLLGKGNYDFWPKEQADWFTAADRNVLESKEATEIPEEPIQTASGETRYLRTWKIALRDEDGEPAHLLGISVDITERKQAEENIRALAFYDTLTQLPNRRLLNDRLDQVLAASKRSGHYGALLFMDLDNFKPLNDAHGHGVGDLLLMEVAHRLTGCVREVDTVARFGGDEFVVVLSELDADKTESTAQAGVIAEKIRATLAEPYVLTIQPEGKAETITVGHHCTSSIGVVLFINHKGSPEDILRWADMAMYQAKEAGRNLIRFYDSTVE